MPITGKTAAHTGAEVTGGTRLSPEEDGRLAMATQHHEGRLSPETLALCGKVLEETWKELVDSYDLRVSCGISTREDVARRIIRSALEGERDPARLALAARHPPAVISGR
jgi:hypothetical protein